jgi:hypothetical protein
VPGKYHEAYQNGIKETYSRQHPSESPEMNGSARKMFRDYITDILNQEANTDINDLTHVPIATRK